MENNSNPETVNALTEIFGECIHSYSRAQGIADGELVDITSTAAEAGFRHPCAVTRALWCAIETIPARVPWQDREGRLWDIVWMAEQAAGKQKPGVSRFVYEVILHRSDIRSQYSQIVMDCGPGDNAEPVLTVGFAEDF